MPVQRFRFSTQFFRVLSSSMIIPFLSKKINPYFQKTGVDFEKFIFYSQPRVQSAKISPPHTELQRDLESSASWVILVSLFTSSLSMP